MEKNMMLPCSHTFCQGCYEHIIVEGKCPLCHAPFYPKETKSNQFIANLWNAKTMDQIRTVMAKEGVGEVGVGVECVLDCEKKRAESINHHSLFFKTVKRRESGHDEDDEECLSQILHVPETPPQ